RVLEVVALLRLHWKDGFGDTSRTRLLPRLDNLPGLNNLRKTTCQGGFFVSGEDYAGKVSPVKNSYEIDFTYNF
ncbi:hypothetical protein KEQ29_24855, partial [Escherichia coli]|nr:hypothetical protein [Escherichia coli]MCV5164036.1 hypothetical protein [Escherichia coli]